MASGDSKMSKQGTAGKRKHVTLATRLKVVKAELYLWLTQHWIVTCLQYNETDGPAMLVYTASSDRVKGRLKRQLLKWPKLAEVDRVWCRCLTAMWSRGKPMIIEKVKSFLWCNKNN
jgi:hypothetical protein